MFLRSENTRKPYNLMAPMSFWLKAFHFHVTFAAFVVQLWDIFDLMFNFLTFSLPPFVPLEIIAFYVRI